MTLRVLCITLIPLVQASCEPQKSQSSRVEVTTSQPAETDPGPDFNREIRPILSDHCFRCHGPDAEARKAGLRMDSAEGSYAVLASGNRAIVPGDPLASELMSRITSDDADFIMPPPELNMPLSATEIETLQKWIESGGEYKAHWAFTAPRELVPPNVKVDDWSRNEIDRFVFAKLSREHLAPEPEADRSTLLRRVSFVLTGLPPSPEDVASFVADPSSAAYESRVDRLLASSRYGERMAMDWLDVARFADTYGYQSDWECRVWPWRDWVIDAFNSNMPYNEFVREQIAGDLLPGATIQQRLATAFCRLHRQTNEGGSIDEEMRQEYVSDRVHTFGTAFLGLTVECARCHDHKYDPILQDDYYNLCAFFGSIDESGTYPYTTGATPRPAMRLLTAEQRDRAASLEAAVAAAEENYLAIRDATRGKIGQWLSDRPKVHFESATRRYPLAGAVDGPFGKATAFDGDTGVSVNDAPAFRRSAPWSLCFWMNSPDSKQRAAVIHTSKFTIESDEQGYQVMLKDGKLCWEIVHYWPGSAAAIRTARPFPLNRWTQVCVTYDGSSRAAGLRIYFDGMPVETEVVRDHLDGPATARTFQVGFRDRDLGFKGGSVGDVGVFERELSALEVRELAAPGTLASALAMRGTPSIELEEYYFLSVDNESRAAAQVLRDARAAQQEFMESIPEIMVMEEGAPSREFYVLKRGRYDDPDHSRPSHPVRVIDAVLPMNKEWPHNRLGLAEWTTDPQNPLTARVAVNRLWAICFGRGLVVTQENFGLQGDSPSHPELLDTLAVEFVGSGWNVKKMLRRIVLSATFRQDSTLSSEKVTKDPQNILLSHGPAVRLSAEALRDQAIFVSGLLVEKIGGPSVRPWQPPGLWADSGATAQGNGEYVPDTGENAHRRSLYTFRKRTVPPPGMLAFDAGSRELCLARRQPTNTPLQPLVLLNDRVFVECAQRLASRVTSERESVSARLDLAFQYVVSREARPAERMALQELYANQVIAFEGDSASARELLNSETVDVSLAALTIVCSTLLASDAAETCR